jgi:hypothetical protein
MRSFAGKEVRMNRNKLTFLAANLSLVFLVSLFSAQARADVAGALCERDRGSHVDVMTSVYSQACLGHVDSEGGRYVRTVVLPEPMSGDVRASRDHRTVIYIASYLSLSAKEALALNPVVVRVYRGGALQKEHRLHVLVTAADLQESISHVRFARTVGSIDANNQLTIVTNGGARLVLDGMSGALKR